MISHHVGQTKLKKNLFFLRFFAHKDKKQWEFFQKGEHQILEVLYIVKKCFFKSLLYNNFLKL